MSDEYRSKRSPDKFKELIDYWLTTKPYVGDSGHMTVAMCMRCRHYHRAFKGATIEQARKSVLDHLFSCHNDFVVLYLESSKEHLVICNLCDYKVIAYTHQSGEKFGIAHLETAHGEVASGNVEGRKEEQGPGREAVGEADHRLSEAQEGQGGPQPGQPGSGSQEPRSSR